MVLFALDTHSGRATFARAGHPLPVLVRASAPVRACRHLRPLYARGMESNGLMIAQARQLQAQVRRELNYLGRLRRRMEVLGFPPADPLYLATLRATTPSMSYTSAATTQGAPAE